MKYFIQYFTKAGEGFKTIYTANKSHLAALKSIHVYNHFNHAMVLSESGILRRYRVHKRTGKAVLIKGEPRYFKTQTSPSKFAILVMLDKATEIIKFGSEKERDEAFEKACMESTPVASVENDKEHNDITVSYEGIDVSKSGLTSTKTSNGSAKRVTWMDSLTHFSTAASSGTSSVKSSAEEEWKNGSTPSPSQRKLTFATVKKLPTSEKDGYPGWNRSMKKLEGTVVEVKPGYVEDVWYGGDWAWKAKWLDFGLRENEVVGTVKDVRVGATAKETEIMFVSPMTEYIGKTLKFRKDTFEGKALYVAHGWNFAPEWIDLHKKKTVKKGKFIGGTSVKNLSYLSGMNTMVGKVLEFEKSVGTHWFTKEKGSSGWYVDESWIDFNYEETPQSDNEKLKVELRALKRVLRKYIERKDSMWKFVVQPTVKPNNYLVSGGS